MRILVLGSGAKDHALTYWISRSKRITALFMAPGNPGTKNLATNLNIDITNSKEVYDACIENKIDLVFIGTESPLEYNVQKYLRENNIRTYGAKEEAIKLDSNRVFARGFSQRHNIKMPSYRVFEKEKDLASFLNKNKDTHFVIKTNKMRPSRVMIDSCDTKSLLDFAKPLLKDGPILVEDHISGFPVTATLILDEKGYLKLPFSCDYTKTNQEGKATGGMGAIAPAPISEKIYNKIEEDIIKPVINGLIQEKLSYKGILTLSLLINNNEPLLLDYHVRFNDPSFQSIVPLLESDVVDVFNAIEEQSLLDFNLEVIDKRSVAVVIANQGYPTKPVMGNKLKKISPVFYSFSKTKNSFLFFGALCEDKKKNIVSSGGRLLSIVATGSTIQNANQRVYEIIKSIEIENSWYRNDIGNKFFEV